MAEQPTPAFDRNPAVTVTGAVRPARQDEAALQVTHDRHPVRLAVNEQGGLRTVGSNEDGHDVPSRLTRAAAEKILASGHSVVWRGAMIDTVDQLPQQSQLLREPAQRRAAAEDIDAQIRTLQQQRDELRKAPPPESPPPQPSATAPAPGTQPPPAPATAPAGQTPRK